MASRKGDGTSPPCSLRSGDPAGSTAARTTARKASATQPTRFSARLSTAPIGSSFSTTSPVYLPASGSTIRSITRVPTSDSSTAEQAMK